MPLRVIESGAVTAFAADLNFVEGWVGVAMGRGCVRVLVWVGGEVWASGVAADAVVGDAAAEASGVIWFVAGCDIPAGIFGVPVNG